MTKLIITKGYKAVMSSKVEIRIDEDEIQQALEVLGRGQMALVRQGLINPSYLVAIVEDTERRAKFLEDTKYPQDEHRRAAGMERLGDIFADRPLQLPGGGRALPATQKTSNSK